MKNKKRKLIDMITENEGRGFQILSAKKEPLRNRLAKKLNK